MKEKQKYEQQLLLRTTVAPGNPTTVAPGSPNATQASLMEEVSRSVDYERWAAQFLDSDE